MVPVSQLENCDSRNNPLKEGYEPISDNVDSYIDFDMFHFIVSRSTFLKLALL